jgi:signal peptidase I
MSLSRQIATRASAISSLFIQALREGQGLWFQVASGSMLPTLNVGDKVWIEPAKATDIHHGEIAAFESTKGLVIHRIVAHEYQGTDLRLLEINDVKLSANWIVEQAVVGRVITIQRDTLQINLQHPVAQRWGRVTAYLRYKSYLVHANKKSRWLGAPVRKCARLTVLIGNWRILHSSASQALKTGSY